MNLCINLLIIGLCFHRCLLVNFNKFLLSIRIIFALQLSLNQINFLVVLMLNNSALDTRDPQTGIILLEVGLLDLNYPSSHVSFSFSPSFCISFSVSTCVPLSLCIILMIMSLSLLYS